MAIGKLGYIGRLGIPGTGGGSISVQKDMYFSGKNAYIYACSKNGIKELHLYGHSEQDGIPTLDIPVEIFSVGDNYLQLYALDINHPDKGGQIIDFGDIKLRSLPNGVCDEIVYREGKWKLIQRINFRTFSEFNRMNDTDGVSTLICDFESLVHDGIVYGNGYSNISIVYTRFSDASANPELNGSFLNSYSYNVIFPAGTTLEDANNRLTSEVKIIYELAEPIETVLDLPQIEFSSETIYLLTNEQAIKPYLQGYYDVDLKVSGKKLEYAQDGLIGWWQSFGLNNVNKPTVIPDKLGNHDLTIRNLNYTNESGFHPTYLQFDGIDDNANVKIERYIGFIQAVVSDLTDTGNQRLSLLSNWAGSGSINIIFNRNELNISNQVADSAKGYIDGEEVTSYNIVNGDGSIHTLAISNSKDGYNLHNIGISGAFNSANNYFVKERFYEAVAYNRTLSGEEIQNNFLVSQVRNGVNIPDSVDPIDIIAERTYASGKKFPVYNTYRDRDNDNIESFKILGYTVQEGTPTPEAPIPLLSVGDEGLKLCISDSETGIALQVIDFGNIVLRSLPNGVCDSIEWDGKNWRLVQRIVSIIIDENTTIQDQLEASNRIVVQVNYTLVTKSSANNTNLCSKISNSASSVPRFHNYPTTIYVVWNSNKPATFEEAKSIIMGAEFCCELAEPIETILEGIPAPQTFDNETWFGTPSALVKPYMMCECKVKKALKYQGDISAWWYFGGNKSNETDRQITDLSGNENDLIPYNVIWTRESGFNQGWFHFDAIDDYAQALLKETIQANDGFTIQLVVKNFSNNIGFKTMAGFVTNINGGAIRPQDTNSSIGNVSSIATITNTYNFRVVCNLDKQINANNYKDNTIYAKIKSNTVINANGNSSTGIPDITDKSDNDFRVGYSGGDYFEILLLKGYVNEDIIENNKKLLLQRNGVDGDINIIPEPEV